MSAAHRNASLSTTMSITTRFLLISDTHGEDVPLARCVTADVAIHCGDLTEESKIQEFSDTLDLLRGIPAPLKLVIAGNHDFTLDEPTFRNNITRASEDLDPGLVEREFGRYGEARKLFEDAKAQGIYFLDEGTHRLTLGNGAALTVFASPFTPSTHDTWGFHYKPQQHDFSIPEDVDVVITHGPPHGIMDQTDSRRRAGCPVSFGAVARRQPKMHCFGHIHEGWGAKLVTWRDTISETPSHFSDIDNSNSAVIEKLNGLKGTKFDTTEDLEDKLRRREALDSQGFIKSSHSAGDERPLRSGQTLFVNAAIQGTTDDYPLHLPRVVDLDLPACSE